MKFSVLLPTRNRLELLHYAVESIRRQDYQDWEVVVSDNDSTEDVAGYIASLGDARVRYVRTDRFVPVTDNWNNALAHSSGDYVVMLGDDDCLLPGYFSTSADLISRYSDPDCIYSEAVQFAYPGVIRGHEKGFVQTSYSDLLRGREEPFLLDHADAMAAVRKSMSLRFSFSYNMQHSLISRRVIDSLALLGPFFQSPYPDYYASNVLLLVCRSLVVVPRPLVAIGISPKSFGYYYFNDRADEGTAFLKNLDRSLMPQTVLKYLLPGNPLITSWYLAMVYVERNFGRRYGVSTSAARYRFAQVFMADRAEGIVALRRYWPHLQWRERLQFSAAIVLMHLLPRLRPRRLAKRWASRWFEKLSPYPVFDPRMRTVEYQTILDLFEATPSARAGSAREPLAARMDPVFSVMADEIEAAAAIYRPSRFWENLNGINLEMLSNHGLENFKRTVAQNYFNWLVISKRDNQFRSVFKAWLRNLSLRPFLNVLEIPHLLRTTVGLERHVGRKELFIYKLFVGMLWELTLRGDRTGLAATLEEPLLGNPVVIRRRGRRISQDLANSIREFNTLIESEPALLGQPKRIAELGAGYGRLGHVLLSDPGTQYYIFDIPPALYVSQWYLSRLFEGEKIFRFRHLEDFASHQDEIRSCRAGFFTSNQIELFPAEFFDAFVSISTLPEMTEAQNRNYIHHIQRTSARLVYLKQWTEWENREDARNFTRRDVALGAPFRCILHRSDAVQDRFSEQLWRRDG